MRISNVDHPSHYQREGRKECIVEMEEKFGRRITAIFCLTNAYKYLYRAGEKEENSKEQDMAKARWYFNYVRDHFESQLYGNSKNLIALYLEVQRGLGEYD